ncbi:MAG: tRNA (N(6)-L-threonylcarbamoyladenosine(37)-C(2))-methylthiotransferase MtaB [Desulfobaccales bacterium]
MPTFRVITFGCKVNQCDSAGMTQELTARGWSAAPSDAVPDLMVVNTCTVTKRADQQARQTVRRLAREHPGLSIWVTGCYAQRAPHELAALPEVQAIFGNQEKARLAHMLKNFQDNPLYDPSFPSPLLGESWGGGENPPPPSPLPPGEGEEGISAKKSGVWQQVRDFSEATPFSPWQIQPIPGQTRARLKIQEGCSHRCSYCIVPKVRGPRRSLEPEAVLAAMQELAGLGYREVVLTGVDLGQYGLDHSPPSSLAALVQRITKITKMPFRVRLSSLEPQMVTPELLDTLAAWPNFCPHFHLPLQSGAAPVLTAMGRPYGPEEFRDLVHEITRRFPGVGLGLDVLVGFPGETDSDFEATRVLVDELPVTYLHVFPYSPRPGTLAAALRPLPGGVIQERARVMRELGRQKKQQFMEAQLGQVREVLVEGPTPQPGYLQGLSDHYLRVVFPGPADWRNRLIKVRLLARQGEVLRGEVVG